MWRRNNLSSGDELRYREIPWFGYGPGRRIGVAMFMKMKILRTGGGDFGFGLSFRLGGSDGEIMWEDHVCG
jgi:hypothetical protein